MGPAPRPRWAKQGGGREGDILCGAVQSVCQLPPNPGLPYELQPQGCRGVSGGGGGLEAALGLLRASLRRQSSCPLSDAHFQAPAALVLGACGWPFCLARQHLRVTWRQPFSTPSHSAVKCRAEMGERCCFQGPGRHRPVQPDQAGADSPGTVWTLSACDLPSARSGTTCKPHPIAGGTPGHNAQSPRLNNAFYLHFRLCIVRSCWFTGPRLSLHMLKPPPEESLRNLVLGSERS